MNNVNANTGIRFGYIAGNSLHPDLVDALLCGTQARDLSYEGAYAEAKDLAKAKYRDLIEEADISAAESGADREVGFDRERSQEMWFDSKGHEYDEDQFVEDELESFSDQCQIDEPYVEGEYEGVKYGTSWLGGALNFFIFEGPVGNVNRLCSPCVPNAGDCGSGFTTYKEMADNNGCDEDTICDTDFDTGYECYVVPRDWLYEVEVTA